MIFPNSQRERLRRWHPTARYLARTEVHVFALSVSASVLLSFFPFLIVIVSLCKYGLRWPAAVNAIYFGIRDSFPDKVSEFLLNNLRSTIESRGPVQVTSLVLLLFTANGVFEPLEVALNRVWGVAENRSYLKNQLLSLGLILLCGGMILGSFLLTAQDQQWMRALFGASDPVPHWLTWILFKLAAIPITILALFLVYWLLPNCRVPARRVAPVAFLVGLALEALKSIYLLVWPLLNAKLESEYGPFKISVQIVLLSFAASMIVLAGGEWSARKPDEPDTLEAGNA